MIILKIKMQLKMNKIITKNNFLKLIISINNIYFTSAMFIAYKWDKFLYTKNNPSEDIIGQFKDSTLITEFGIIIYILSILFFMLCFFTSLKNKKTWMLVSLIPVITVVVLLLILKVQYEISKI